MDYDPQQQQSYRERGGKKHKHAARKQKIGQQRVSVQKGYNFDNPLGPTAFNLNPKVAAALSYTLWWLTGLFFLIAERKNRFIRFHALQSILTFVVISIGWAIVHYVFSLPVIHLFGFFVLPALGFLVFLLWASLIVLALLGKSPRIPVLGHWAARMAGYPVVEHRRYRDRIEPGI